MKNILIACSGANKEILENCPTEIPKYVSVGLSVLLTSVLASLSGGYAIYVTFNNTLISFLFGALWGAIIFNLDRYIIISISKNQRLYKQIISAIPRILIAIILSITISKPIELRLFEGKITKELSDKEVRHNDEFVKKFNKDRNYLLLSIQKLKTEKFNYDNDVIIKDALITINNLKSDNDIHIKKISRDTGQIIRRLLYGRINKNNKEISELNNQILLRKKVLNRQIDNRERITEDQIKGMQGQIASMDKTRDSIFNHVKFISSKDNDILSRLIALRDIKEGDDMAWAVSNMITILFLLIETSPILIKLMGKPGVYDDLLQKNEINILNNERLMADNFIAKEKYKMVIDQKTNQTTVDYTAKKKLYLNKVKIDKWYDKELLKINKK